MADNLIATSVWVFHGDNRRFSSGVFRTFELADSWVKLNKLTGVLTEYPLDKGVYDWSVENKLFEVKKDSQKTSAFIQTFTSASQQHFHYENGSIE
jgi:hypothetical protein